MDFESAKQALRNTLVYERACRTESVMWDAPSNWNQRKPIVAQNQATYIAYRRLDWLIKGALVYDFEATMMPLHIVAAIDGFLCHLDATQPSLIHVSAANRAALESRVNLCREILKISQAERVHYGDRGIVGDRWFEQFLINHGHTLDDLVYQNPFKFMYYAPGGFGGIGSSAPQLEFHRKMRRFWL